MYIWNIVNIQKLIIIIIVIIILVILSFFFLNNLKLIWIKLVSKIKAWIEIFNKTEGVENDKTMIKYYKNHYTNLYKFIFVEAELRYLLGNSTDYLYRLILDGEMLAATSRLIYNIKDLLIYKNYFFKFGTKKNAYFSFFFEKKKNYTDWYWNIRN